MDYVEICLTPAEIFQGAIAGVMRRTKAIQVGRRHRHGLKSAESWQMDVEGCLGEMALAKHLGLFWTGAVGAAVPGDVGAVEVRTTARHDNRLILHPDDGDEAIFFLVTGCDGLYRIQGWTRGVDGKREEFWQDPGTGRPAFFVPKSALHPSHTYAIAS